MLCCALINAIKLNARLCFWCFILCVSFHFVLFLVFLLVVFDGNSFFLLHSVNYCLIRVYTFALIKIEIVPIESVRRMAERCDPLDWDINAVVIRSEGQLLFVFLRRTMPFCSSPHLSPQTLFGYAFGCANGERTICYRQTLCSLLICMHRNRSVRKTSRIYIFRCVHLWPCAAAACCRCTLRRSRKLFHLIYEPTPIIIRNPKSDIDFGVFVCSLPFPS